MRKNLTKKERIKKKTDIKNTFASGKRFTVSGAKMVFKKNNFEFSRFMITLVRNYGNAVERNRAKRIAREIYRINKHQIKPGYDIIFIFFPDKDSFRKREEQMLFLFKKSGLYSNKGESSNKDDATG